MTDRIDTPLFEVVDLKKSFPLKYTVADAIGKKPHRALHAVDGVSFRIEEGQTLGLVGESGCGKSTLARTILRLYEPESGSIYYEGKDITHIAGAELQKQRSAMQMIFQDPYSSLNPRMSIRQILSEALRIHDIVPEGPNRKAELEQEIYQILDLVGMHRNTIDRYPGEFSGGQRQRIGIARALAVHPKFIVADEPVSALDVSIQAQVLNLMADIQDSKGISYLFISHDLSVVRMVSHHVAVMYLGIIIEQAPTELVYQSPHHPYTEILMKAAPALDPTDRKKTYAIEGEPPSPVDMPSGCRFHPRCPYATELCKTTRPEFAELEPEHFVACHYPRNLKESDGSEALERTVI